VDGKHRRHGLSTNGRCGLARRKRDLDGRSPLWQSVLAGLRSGRSPQQVAGRLRELDPMAGLLPPGASRASHETIYCAIYAQPRGALKTELM
jgi:transposase, IS30 family